MAVMLVGSDRHGSVNFSLVVGRFALLSVDIAGAFHAGTVGVNQKARRFSTGIEMLVPGENRNHQRVPFLPFVLLIFDDAVALTRNYVISLLVDVAMGARSFARRDLGEQSAENFHMEPQLGVDAVRDSAHRR